MKLYKDNDNDVYAYELDGSQDDLIGDKTAITQEEADSIALSVQTALLNLMTYAELRASAYPAIGDQLDALYHAGVFPEDMAAQIQAVKERYPKT